jgi:hypothetical protein
LRFLKILNINPLLDVWLANIFSSSVGCLFTINYFHSYMESKTIELREAIVIEVGGGLWKDYGQKA